MARPQLVLGFVLCLSVLSWASRLPCLTQGLVQYTAIFTANWTKDHFPKQFPTIRPPAQWSRVVGLSHNAEYRLFQLGAVATQEFKLFAETGKQEILGNYVQSNDILDEFLIPAIKNGSGRMMADFIVSRNHSKVSLAARIIPSPDWFVGVDNLDLCADGHWIDKITIEASPLDAGTDSGFTFTAPNWATEPQEAIYKITSQYPRHAANSFFYPHLRDLPAIATFQIIKKRIETENLTMHSLPASERDVQLNDVVPWKHIKKKSRKKKSNLRKCQVGPWSEWSTCNGPCGQSQRLRNMTKLGYGCPPLLQERTCGCTKYVFNW